VVCLVYNYQRTVADYPDIYLQQPPPDKPPPDLYVHAMTTESETWREFQWHVWDL
jgi:hypothetical protein